ncbi:PGPI peptidase, partial [Sylvia atricapilla]|nr:PGPI peptidase [Sylvia atricapilla]
ELEKLGLRDDVDLHVYEVPVEYQTVQRLIPALWKKHSPQVNSQFLPEIPSPKSCHAGRWELTAHFIWFYPFFLVFFLNVLCLFFFFCVCSRYLCDFTYYTSLYQSRGRSAFVHVPPLGKPYSAEQLGRALQAIIEEMLQLLEHSEDKINCQHEH